MTTYCFQSTVSEKAIVFYRLWRGLENTGNQVLNLCERTHTNLHPNETRINRQRYADIESGSRQPCVPLAHRKFTGIQFKDCSLLSLTDQITATA